MRINVGDIAVQVQQRVHLDGGFVLPEFGPRKQRKAQIDGGGVQGIQALVQIDANRIVGVQRPCDGDRDLREIRENPPIVGLVGVGQRRARYLAAQPHVVEFARHRPQARLDIAQALTVSQLRKGHCQILVQTREAS